jgi:hypothetical protein
MKTSVVCILLMTVAAIILPRPAGSARNMKHHAEYQVGTVSLDAKLGLTFRLAIWGRQHPKTVVIRVLQGDPEYSEMLKLAPGVHLGQTKPLPPWRNYFGILTMAEDKTVSCYTRIITNEGDAIFASVFEPNSLAAKQYIDHVGGLLPGQAKPLPTWPESVGVARMAPDGTVTAYLRSEAPGQPIAEAKTIYKPGDPKYDEMVAHIGGIKPGEEKPIPPWK